jgi:LmbE family N-acetylglucosaminyl deacetylase
VITVTDGAPASPAAARAVGYATPRELASVRLLEQRAALDLLGRDLALMVNFGVHDQRAAYHIVPIVRRLVKIFARGRFDVVVTHPYEGGHPDHDATALAVQVACALLSRAGSTAPRVVEMTSYHSRDGLIVYDEFLPHACAGPVATFPLDDESRQLKQKMYACHASQQRVLARFPLEAEKFREAPSYDFLRPPQAGPLTYDGYGWGIDGESWCRAAARSLHHMGLLRRRRRPGQLAAGAAARSPEGSAARGEATSTMKTDL